jgi:hypothetical protein
MTEDHRQSSSAFERERIACTAGVFGQIRSDDLTATVSDLLRDADRRSAMGARARQLVDGRGAGRVADAIWLCAENRRGSAV